MAVAAALQVKGLSFRYLQRKLFADWSIRIRPGVM